MVEIYELFQSICPLPPAFWKELSQTVVERKLARKSFLLEAGQICKDIHFVKKGIARSFYYLQDQEITSWLMKENDLIISVESFYKQAPSNEFIELMEDSIIISLGYDQLQTLYKKYLEFNYVARVLTERYYLLSEERSYSIKMQTAQTRYQNLLSRHPEVFQRFPLKHIASFLGIQPETLSRLRANLR